MSPYKLITGTDKNISAFEEQISAALLEGYDLANDLVVQLKTLANGETETLLFQSLISDEALGFEEEEEEDEEENEEEEEEEEPKN
jgi:hypothetical protein